MLINAVKEQQQQIEAQQNFIDQQKLLHEQELNELKAQVEELKGLVFAKNQKN